MACATSVMPRRTAISSLFQLPNGSGSAAAAPRPSEYQSGGRRASTTGPAAARHATRRSNQCGAAVGCGRLLSGVVPEVVQRSPHLENSPSRQQACEAKTEPVWIRNGEIAQTVIAIRNRNDDLCADLVRHLPVLIDVGDHH